MNKIMTGLVAGTVIGAVGLAYALNDKRTRRKMIRDGKDIVDMANSAIGDLTNTISF